MTAGGFFFQFLVQVFHHFYATCECSQSAITLLQIIYCSFDVTPNRSNNFLMPCEQYSGSNFQRYGMTYLNIFSPSEKCVSPITTLLLCYYPIAGCFTDFLIDLASCFVLRWQILNYQTHHTVGHTCNQDSSEQWSASIEVCVCS